MKIYNLICALFLATFSLMAQDDHDTPMTMEEYLETLNVNDKSCFLNNNNWEIQSNLLPSEFSDEINPEILIHNSMPTINQVLAMEPQDIQLRFQHHWREVIGQSNQWEAVVGRGSLATENRFFEDAIKFIRVSKINNPMSFESYQIEYAWYIVDSEEAVINITHLVTFIGDSNIVQKKIKVNMPRRGANSFMTLFPNPAREKVDVFVQDGFKSGNIVKVLNLKAVLLKEIVVKNPSKKLTVDVSDLIAGTYFIEVYKNNLKLDSKTLIVKK